MTGRRDEMTAPWDREDSASLKLLRLIAQSTNDGIWDWDLETDEVYYSPRWLELVGYLPGELPGHIDTFINLLHPDDRTNAERVVSEYREGLRSDYRNEFRLQHKDQSWRWILTRGIVIREPTTGRAVRFVGTHTDITDRVRAAERLKQVVATQAAIALENARLYRDLEEREAKIRRLVDSNIIGIFMWDFEGQILEANEAFLHMVGYDHEELAAGRMRWTDLTPPDWRDRDIAIDTRAQEDRDFAPVREGVLPERRQPCSRANRRGNLRRRRESRRRFRARLDAAQASRGTPPRAAHGRANLGGSGHDRRGHSENTAGYGRVSGMGRGRVLARGPEGRGAALCRALA